MASKIGASANPDFKDIKYNNASLPDVKKFLAAGIDPKTGLPYRAGKSADGFDLKENNKKLLQIIDEQDAVNRFDWENLPYGLNGKLIERILYYRGQGILFRLMEKYYFLPYALNGTIDVYGRFTKVTPYPFNGTATDGEIKKKEKPFIQGLILDCIYDIPQEKLKEDSACIILNDYTPQISQNLIPHSIFVNPVLDVMADCIPFLRTALLNGTGVMGMRVGGQDDYSNVAAASASINRCARTGEKFVPIIGTIDFQQLTGGPVAKAEEFLLTMQSLNNYRLSLFGLENGGFFQKKAHVLESEESVNSGAPSLVMQDCLSNRKSFCELANKIFGLSIDVEISESAKETEGSPIERGERSKFIYDFGSNEGGRDE